jgi:kynureninase
MKSLYSRFFAADPSRLHFAAHSHHPWPDVTREAQLEAWDDAAGRADLKWDKVFGSVIPEAQGHIAAVLDLPEPSQIAFAPNTHEFVSRLLSCFPPGRKLNLVTTDAEFLSFSRQVARLEEEGLVSVVRVPTEPFATFTARFRGAAAAASTDLVFFSQVFFNSGFVVRDLESVAEAAAKQAMLVIDGYHGFFAVPTNLRRLADRAFYLAGGYKYAQSGEGVCFMSVPRHFDRKPLNTGWFAGFGTLEAGGSHRVPFASDGSRFMGATFDPVGLYRFNAVARAFASEGLTVSRVHAHVKSMQRLFLEGLSRRAQARVRTADLIAPDSGIDGLGHFLTFRRDDAGAIAKDLLGRNVIVDHRGDRLRFGFGAYHDASDVLALLGHL